jgi:hypothetical protein
VGVAGMMATAIALKNFFGSFGLPAYSTDTVPDDVEVPYITFLLNQPEWSEKASGYAQVWYRTKSNSVIFNKAEEIIEAIGFGKIIELPENKGYIVLYPENPKVQVMVDGDYRAAVINYSINSYNMPGV